MQGPAQEPQLTGLPATEVIAPPATGNYGNPVGAAPVESPNQLPGVPLPDGHIIQGAQYAAYPQEAPLPSPIVAPGTEPAAPLQAPQPQSIDTRQTWGPAALGPDVASDQAPAQTQPIGGAVSEQPQPYLSAITSAPPAAPTPAPFLGTPQNLGPDVAPSASLPPAQESVGAWIGPAAPATPAPVPKPESFITTPAQTQVPTTENPFGNPTALGPDISSDKAAESGSQENAALRQFGQDMGILWEAVGDNEKLRADIQARWDTKLDEISAAYPVSAGKNQPIH